MELSAIRINTKQKFPSFFELTKKLCGRMAACPQEFPHKILTVSKGSDTKTSGAVSTGPFMCYLSQNATNVFLSNINTSRRSFMFKILYMKDVFSQ